MIVAPEIRAAARAYWQAIQARPDQLEPEGDWNTWLILSGRGWGKTRTGAEWIVWNAVQQPDTRWAVIAPTYGDARDTCIEGVSGVRAVLKRYDMEEKWNRSLGEVQLKNGSRIKLFSADEPDRLRGPQHHGCWADEMAAWRYLDETWDQLKFGLRLGTNPQVVITTTPRPRKLLRNLTTNPQTTVTRGSTFDNAANLSAAALADLRARYEGTRLGKQELYGEYLEDVDGALWTLGNIERDRVTTTPPNIVRRVVAVDPAVTANADSDETGIIVVSRDAQGHGYVEADYSMRGTPNEWATRVVQVFDQHECDNIVVEVNQGGDMVTSTLRTVRASVPVKAVRATQGKRLRAEPVSSLYEQGRVHHVGVLEELESQMTSWTPDDVKSPDRLDALVHGLTELMQGGGAEAYLRSIAVLCACGYPNPQGAQVCAGCGATLKVGLNGVA